MSNYPNFIKFEYSIFNVADISSVSHKDSIVTIGMQYGPDIIKEYNNSVQAAKAVCDIWELIKNAHKTNTRKWI